MRNVLLLIVVLVGCGGDSDVVSCDTFRDPGYRFESMDDCIFDVSGLDWTGKGEPQPPPFETTPLVLEPGGVFGDVLVVDEDAEVFRTRAITWNGDDEAQGGAVFVGELDADTCVWVRCTSVEPQP